MTNMSRLCESWEGTNQNTPKTSTTKGTLSQTYRLPRSKRLKACELPRVASAVISPVRLLGLILTVLTETTTQMGDDTGHSSWLYSTLWHSLSKHAGRSAVPAPKHKRGPCFVVVAQSPAFWSSPVMLPWRLDSSSSPRHSRVRPCSAISQIYTVRTCSWQPPSPLQRHIPVQATALTVWLISFTYHHRKERKRKQRPHVICCWTWLLYFM